MDQAGPSSSNQDPRFDFIGSYAVKSLKLKPEKWLRVLSVEEHRSTLKDFVDKPFPVLLVVVLTHAAQLVPVISFPCYLKNKAVYFVKKKPAVVPKENCSEMVIFGDLAPRLIDELAALVDEVFVPLLSNPLNHEGWPLVVSQDILKQIHSLKSTVYEVKGKVNGQTVLPMPVGVELVYEAEKGLLRGEEVDLYLKSAIEGVIIKWAQQINDVMMDDSGQAFDNGQNPVPSVELAFWKSRLSNLNYIYDQLRGDRVRCMAVILEKTNSAYYPCFTLAEAQEIDLYLRTLVRHFQGLEDTDFTECQPLFRPLFHVICMIWRDSKYYCSSSKLMVLLKEICNLLIYQAKKCLDPSTLFHSDIDEATQRIQVTINILKKFRETFEYFKDILGKYFVDRTVIPWTFHPNVVFERMNRFLDRLNTIQWFFKTVMEFQKLEKIEIGGMKGRVLSGQIRDISAEFDSYFHGFASKSYDVLDPDDDKFDEDFKEFQDNIVDLDLKLSTVLVESFDSCSNLESVFKLIDIIGSVLDRPLIKNEFTAKYVEILVMLEEELVICEDLFKEQSHRLHKYGHMEVDTYLPPVAGGLLYMSTLAARITKPIACFRNLPHPIKGSEEALKLFARYDKLIEDINAFKKKYFNDWTVNVPKIIEQKTKNVILSRHGSDLVLNFSPMILDILKEVHHLRNNPDCKTLLPKESLELFEKQETYRQYRINLGITIDWYNQIRKNSQKVEFDLVESEIKAIDLRIDMAQNELNWNSQDLWNYLQELHKLDTLLNLDDRQDRINKRYSDIETTAQRITDLLKENMELFNMQDNQDSEIWLNYVAFIDNLFEEALFKTIACSLGYISEHMEPKNKLAPLFEAQLELLAPDMVFNPSFDPNDKKGFTALIMSLIDDILKMASLVERIYLQKEESYETQITRNTDIVEMKEDILNGIEKVIEDANDFCKTFENYSFLWLEERDAVMEIFLTYGRILAPEEIDKIGSEDKDVDVRPFRQALLNTVRKWGNMYKEHLVNNVTSSLSDLGNFIREADEGLLQPVPEGDYDALVTVMGYLMNVKDRAVTTDDMFHPLTETIELLKFYDMDIPEEVNVLLQELPDQWQTTKKLALTVKQQVAPLQAAEVSGIRKKIATFDSHVTYYRDVFKRYEFFKYDCEDPYTVMSKVDYELINLEESMKGIQESGSLFEVNVPEFKLLKQCRKELRMLKQLWDYVYIVRTSIDDWKTTPWRKIDVENMDIECKKFAKEIRLLDKEMRSWDTYINLEATVKNMLTSLRAVGELQNPAIRERHWNQLMRSTKVRIVMDANTTLADLLALNLHECEEEVKNIVDKAVKEMSMEKTLKDLNTTWSGMEFEQEVHKRTGCILLRASEELIETLEENQVQLQNLITSKFIAHFLEEVSGWQQKLSIADQVITVWFEVQRTWTHLESIFMSSEDIRKQLPDDSARFDRIDTEFKILSKDMSKTPNVVKGTNKEGLVEKLDGLQNDLIICEKALAEYLETKRLAFPRFYFVSSADLLDILSNGNQADLVIRHLTKLFDSIAKLKFIEAEDKPGKIASGMIAKDGEYVPFHGSCDCTGPVEVWLNRLQDIMRSTIRNYFGEGMVSYEEKPREQWLFDFMAQVSLCGTQIWWSTEVNIAFARLEEGYDNALKDYFKKQVAQLSTLITLLIGELTKQDRQKIMTICTIDVHSRDVVSKMIQGKVEAGSAFQWQSQLRHRWDEKAFHCFANICDAQFVYSYEYLGNTPRLSCGNIYKGLAQTGAWGCFDEFNRISVEVLSVVAVQVKSVQDAIRDKKDKFNFMGEIISLVPSVGIFITMNPGYAGRTELPENLKALFRPCAMVVPDFELICEIMLVAEGFQDARVLARKFITLYTLCKELLSKQDHYDWGLRAIKSVLVVAGSLKRGDPGRPEEEVLMRALRDFNIPKIVTDDMPVFMGLIGDLFPALEVPRKRDVEFERTVKQAAMDLLLQPEDNFILKVVQLEELLEVRHSVFIIGNAGTGKTQVWKTLFKTYQNLRKKPVFNDLNPKAVTNDELFGVINPATREWKDGLFSVIMRDQANLVGDNPKWIVLDGDIDPMWIESLNTVMDDNKILTLASNERIALTPTMRLMFEISNLRTATPATVSRAGILYINPQDLGWNPYVTSWIETRKIPAEKSNLVMLFDKYIPPCLETIRNRFKKITPIAEMAHIQMLCYLLNCLLVPENTPADCAKELHDMYFVFACVWAFGSAMFQDTAIDYRVEFTKWWVNEFKNVKFPTGGTVFDYYIDTETKQFTPWTEKVPKFELDPDIPLQAVLVPTAETVRIRYFLDLLMKNKHPVMLVGSAGCGKTVLVNEKLQGLSENYAVQSVPFNFYTSSEMLQKVLEKPLEKKAGRNYGPPGTNVSTASIALHNKVSQVFLPTAIKFHYVFNLRDLSNIFQGLLFSSNECLEAPSDLIRLWLHETQRVYGDKLTEDKDIDAFLKMQVDICKKNFEEIDEGVVFEKPNIFCHFAGGIGEPKYMSAGNWEKLNKLLTEAMASYNDLIAAMNLVLFEDAMMHICRINRILESPRGSALLVGVGGSGKQSLSRLAAFISSLEVIQIQLKKGYGVTDLKNELSNLYIKTGLKNVGIMFLMTDAQVANEQFLVLINDMLASGEVADLFPDDEVENIIAGVRNEQLKVVLCFSPVGATLRVRSRKFPALINCTSINWFHEWPQEALVSVAMRFLEELSVLPTSLRDSVSRFMAYVHTSVNTISKAYLANERRYNYTTPKSYLEQINLYAKLVYNKTDELRAKITRLENGLEKLRSTASQVDDLKAKLAIQEIELKQKNDAADRLIERVGVETAKVQSEKALADEEEEKVAVIAEEVSKKQKDCEEDLIKAEPALIAAQEALNTLNKANLTELKSFGSPPGAVTNVTAAVMVLLAPGGKIPKDRSWKAAKMVMAKVDVFLESLVNYDKENIHPDVIKAIQPYLKDSEFEPEFIRTKSGAAAGLCAWVINIIKFFEVFCDVEPKRKALAAANAELAAASEKLKAIKSQVASLEEQLATLTADFEKATAEKLKCQQEADATNRTIQLANRLVNGLASDVLLVCAFISYVGCFTKQYRLDLMHKNWLVFMKTLEPPIPITEGLDPLTMLTDDTIIAVWQNEGLPSDRMSTENATILSNSVRWPLMIDPQLQGVKWIKQKYGDKLRVIRLGQKGYLDTIEKAIIKGDTVLLENIDETVDPVLDPLLGRNLIKKGRAIKIGDKEIEYSTNFRLILHTKLANPHYKPEMQAQTTLVNFTVTRDGLEDQLLAEVVKAERPDLEELKAELTVQQNQFKIQLKELEDDLLSRLSSAGDNILGDTALVENLETTKKTAADIEKKILLISEELSPAELDFFLRFPIKPHVTSPVDFLSHQSWGGICSLASKDEFRNLDRDIETSPKRWKKIVEMDCPEREKFPQEWKNKTAIQRLCMLRAFRPDRMTYAVAAFIEEKMGAKYVENRTVEFSKSFEETSPTTPIFFILSPGVNPLKDVEALGKVMGFTADNGNFHNVSLGQGQEVVAEQAMDEALEKGHWVVLQNIHLVKKWLSSLEKKMESFASGSHENYRLFMSAEPAATPSAHIIPQGILESSIKITNEPPTGMQANIHKALDNFNQETLEMCGKEAEFKAILFALCYFHAVVAERRKFGPQGWNKIYPFNVGDLTISVFVLYNYLEANSKVPWEDLRYLFGEIMYGGHITDDWDRRLCNAYLEELMQSDLVDGELHLAPGFPAPPNTDYIGYHQYIEDAMPSESPYLYGLHPNAEIGFLTTTSENLFRTIFEMQPRDAQASGAATVTREDKVKQMLDEIMEKLPEEFNMTEIMGKVEERTPYVIGELTITSVMEELENALFLDQVPAIWSNRAYPSLLGLSAWFVDLLLRLRELETWATDFVLPSSVWLAGFFNPQSLLTAIMQSTARRYELPLDKMCLQCDVTKKMKEDFTIADSRSAPPDGAYVHGLLMEGARWDVQAGIVMDSRLKELFPPMPVINVRAITQDKQDLRNMYECPVYKTRTRGPTYVWTFNLKTKDKPSKWTLAGVALLLQT
ncbi:hypothetical protein MSG28_011209 [Choristoneura fumiferana]|uniref:Uncharacterized protein n=1 Tax=Choristoneura fumiferana TaxID=7141 RepID=A0ACC0KRG4_CHOFU|nr:hypothetical protein MSG28_011209 [Choristoneura fumiferana]